MEEHRKYAFHWGLIGDIETGRPNLGQMTRVEIYRLMQFTFRDVVEKTYGSAEADRIFYTAGVLAGREFYQHFLGKVGSFEQLILQLEVTLREMRIGILRVEEANLETGIITITISEDLDCSGLPELDYEICTYDEGFIAGVLESFSGKRFKVKEIDCWCTGDRTCRFKAEITE
jgi:uncharacterized protein